MTTLDPQDHERCVQAWLARNEGRSANGGRGGTLLLVGLRALWERARPILGEVTLGAIFRRAIDTAQRRHPELNALGIAITERGSIEMASPSAPRLDLRPGVTFLLVEVLRVVSRLSSGALAQPLYVALTDATLDDPRWLAPIAGEDDQPERAEP